MISNALMLMWSCYDSLIISKIGVGYTSDLIEWVKNYPNAIGHQVIVQN